MSADVTTDLVKESCHHLRGTTEFSALQIQRGMVFTAGIGIWDRNSWVLVSALYSTSDLLREQQLRAREVSKLSNTDIDQL